MAQPVRNVVAARPAETTAGAAAALSVLICAIVGVDDPTIYGALVIVIGFIPTVVTSIVVYVHSTRIPPKPPEPPELPPPPLPEAEVIEPPPKPRTPPRRKRGK